MCARGASRACRYLGRKNAAPPKDLDKKLKARILQRPGQAYLLLPPMSHPDPANLCSSLVNAQVKEIIQPEILKEGQGQKESEGFSAHPTHLLAGAVDMPVITKVRRA